MRFKLLYFYIFGLIFLIASFFLIKSYLSAKFENDQTQAVGTTLLNLNINPGTLSQTVESDSTLAAEIHLSEVDIFTAPPAGGTSTGQLTTTVKDHRGTAAGWSQTASCTDFTSGVNSINITNLTIIPTTLLPIAGSNLAGVTLGSSHTFTGPADITTIVQANPGSGNGRFQTANSLNLIVPKTTIVGNYSATMTITIS